MVSLWLKLSYYIQEFEDINMKHIDLFCHGAYTYVYYVTR